MKIHWSNRDWEVRPSGLGPPGPCHWSPDLVEVDLDRNLHLHIAKFRNRWNCSEIHHEEGLGCGRYSWKVLSDLRYLDPQAVLGLFTYDWDETQSGAGELDIEAAKWGVPQLTNLEYSIQPVATDPDNRNKRLSIGPPPYDASILWLSDEVVFSCTDSSGEHDWTSRSVPPPPTATTWPFLNLWLNRGRAPLNKKPIEIVVANFEFTA